MSWREVKQLFGPTGLTPAQKVVAFAIADRVSWKHGFLFWEKSDRLAERCEMTSGNVRKRLAELVDLGVIDRVEDGQGRASTVYLWAGLPRREDATREQALEDLGALRERGEYGGQSRRENSEPRRECATTENHTSYRETKERTKGVSSVAELLSATFGTLETVEGSLINKAGADRAKRTLAEIARAS